MMDRGVCGLFVMCINSIRRVTINFGVYTRKLVEIQVISLYAPRYHSKPESAFSYAFSSHRERCSPKLNTSESSYS
jgi:hypothetical protein